MAFWGVEVRPGRPVTHSCEKARGRLRISQATLGFGESLTRSVVQCNVGNRSPVLLCVLLPGQSESSHIELEFQEADDVVFSVIGPRSVYLTGYYVQQNRHSTSRSDTESYGVDIENTDDSNYNSDGVGPDSDGYEDSFINDDDELQFSPGSPVFHNKGLDEIMLEKDERQDKKACSKLLTKRRFLMESNDDVNSPKTEDEDDFSPSLHENQRDEKTTTFDAGEKFDQVTDEKDEAKDDGMCDGTKHKLEDKKAGSKLRKRRPFVIESDDDVNSPKNDDEDNFSLSLLESQRDVKTTTCDTGKKVDQVSEEKDDEAKDDGVCDETKHKREDKKAGTKLHKKRPFVIESYDDVDSPKKDDNEDNFSLSLHDSQRDVKTTTCDAGKKIDQVSEERDDEANDDGICDETKQNVDPLDISDKIESITQPPLDEEGTENDGKNETLIDQNYPVIDENDKMQSLDLAKPKNKRKERPITENSSEVQTDNKDPTVHREHKERESDASTDLMGVGEDHLVTAPESDSASGPKSKRRRNKQLEGESIEGTEENFQNPAEVYLLKQDSLHVDGVTEHLPAANKENELQQKPEETSMDKCGLESHNLQSGDEVMLEVHADSKTDNLQAENEENENNQIVSNASTKSGKIKKKKKTKGKKNLNMNETTAMSINQVNEQSTAIIPIDSRSLSNGLIIEELVTGPSFARAAVPGNMIKIFYTGMLKESGIVFDTNVGRSAFKFQLGGEEFIDGWNVGIDGMRVGGERRLIIPPSMGFGDAQVRDIPPNSWLIYDIELVRVYH